MRNRWLRTVCFLPCVMLAAQKPQKPQVAANPPALAPVSAEAGTSAYKAEMAREKRPYCEHVSGTNNVEMCIGKQVDLTEANYRIFKASIRTDLGPSPGDNETTIFQKNTAVASFDKAEKAWLVYRNRECGALEDSYAGGTIAPSMAVECELRLTRSHMRELHLLYVPQS